MQRNKTNEKLEVTVLLSPFWKSFDLISYLIKDIDVNPEKETKEDMQNRFMELHWKCFHEKNDQEKFKLKVEQLMLSLFICEQSLGGLPKYEGLTLFLRFPKTIFSVAKVINYGCQKYFPEGWRKIKDFDVMYENAIVRHLLQSFDETLDDESKCPHISHVVSNVLIWIENKRHENNWSIESFS